MTNTSVLRWGGLTSFGGGVLFILVFAWVIIVPGFEPAGPAGPITKFPEIKAARTVENAMCLAVFVLWVPLYLALYRRLDRTAPALFGSALGIVGLGVLAAGAVPHIATSRLADLYHAAGATPADQATLVLVWQGTQGIFDALLLAGQLIMAIGIVLLGPAMHTTFGKTTARTSTLLGAVGVAAGTVVLVDPESVVAVLGFFALIAFHLVLGWKVYRMSLVSQPARVR